jgi:transcription antitermination factor NusG
MDSIRMVIEQARHFQPWPYTRAGQKVEVTSGPLRGLKGVLIQMRSQRRILVSVTLLQRSVLVDIDVADIRPITEED